MMKTALSSGVLALALVVIGGCANEETKVSGIVVSDDIVERLGQYSPTELTADLSGVPESELSVLVELIRAGKVMDEIFLRQVSQQNPELRDEIAGESEEVRTYFGINFGPWDRLDEMAPFLGEAPHPPGAGYYPVDMTAEEFEGWLAEHPEDEEAFKGLYTVVERTETGLQAVPYSEAYGEYLSTAAEYLYRAAELTENRSLSAFLTSRATAFSSDDYYDSDVAWMDLDSPVEVTIGPYETYEDSLFGYKAAFEAFVTVNVPEESAKLERFKNLLPWLEMNLPIGDEHKNERGTESPIRVVDEVFVGGDSKAGVQTLAFNLPNDERVREEKGSKKVMLRNVLRAKFEQILLPIAERVMVPENLDNIAFDAFFSESLHHELSHGLGPGKITVDGRETEVRLELKELYSTLEEAKADVMGVYNILALVEQGEIDEELRETLVPTYVAGLFRSARFGLHEAHGRGVVSQFNYLLAKGALEVDAEGRFRAVRDSSHRRSRSCCKRC
jgi:hypothetical protein